MQFISITALLGFFLATVDASRCKSRSGHMHHSYRPASSATVTTPSIEATPETTSSYVKQTQHVSTATSAPVSSIPPISNTLALTGPLVPASKTASPTTTTAGSSVESADTSSTTVSKTASIEAESSVSSMVSSASTSAVASAVPIIEAPAPAKMCANNQDTLLTEWGLVVSNFRVQESDEEGTVCTTYNGMVSLPNGQAAAKFTADASLVFDEETINDNKYYSNVGLGNNVPSQLSSISSIPASYSWSRTNTTAFRGNVVFDLVLAPTSDDRTSSATQEVMMWLHWQGDQRPLAWNNGTKATLDLYGMAWDMYQGINYNLADGAGVQVTTILPQQDFGAAGSWSGDIKDWLDALAAQGVFTSEYFVTNANAGTEQYWGKSVLLSTVALEINLKA